MEPIDCNTKSARTTKQGFKFWRILRDRFKRWRMQRPDDYFGEDPINRYNRVEHWREYRLRRQNSPDLFTRWKS